MISQKYFTKVKDKLDGDVMMAYRWFSTSHPAFNMVTPINMIRIGKGEKVMHYIDHEFYKGRELR